MKIKDFLFDNEPEFKLKEDLIQACMAALNVKRGSVTDALVDLKRTKCAVVDNSIGLSADNLREKYDIVYKIEQALKCIPNGRFIPDAEFREVLVKCESSKFRSKAELDQFKQYKGCAKGTTYWGNSDDMKRLKNEGILA